MDRRYLKAERLARQAEIDEVYKRGRKWSARILRIHAKANGLPHSRLAISVPKRLCGSVQRNRWKRLIRETFRLNKETIGPGLDLIVVPSQAPGELTQPQVQAVLLHLVGRHRSAS
jgi:ribonuclease P protein component